MADEQKPKRGSPEGRKRMGKPRSFADNPVGRPRTTLDDLPEGWKELMMAEAQQGASQVTLMVKLGVGATAFNTLLDDYEEFRQTYEACRMLAQHWHETVGRNMMVGANGNAVAWKFAMQNQFGWRDKQQLSGDPEAPIQQSVTVKKQSLSKEELIAELQARGLPTSMFEDE